MSCLSQAFPGRDETEGKLYHYSLGIYSQQHHTPLLLIANNTSVAVLHPQRQKGNLTLAAEKTQGPHMTQKEKKGVKSSLFLC